MHTNIHLKLSYMKILKTIADRFSKKTPAPEQPSAKRQHVDQQSTEGINDAPCMFYHAGELEYPALGPQPLLDFWLLNRVFESLDAACGDISMVQAVSLFHPQTSEYISTVFGIKKQNGWLWVKIGTTEVFFSGFRAFLYKETPIFRLPLKKKDEKTFYKALCKYQKGIIQVTGIVEETLTPPTDADHEVFLETTGLTPCSLDEALEFVCKL